MASADTKQTNLQEKELRMFGRCAWNQSTLQIGAHFFVCVEVEAGCRIPRLIPVKMPDGSTVDVKATLGELQVVLLLQNSFTGDGGDDGIGKGATPSETVGEITVLAEVEVLEDFPLLQNSEVRHRGRGRGRKTVAAVSKNKFEVLVGVDEVIEEAKKPRTASLGVANLLHELKSKKVERIKTKVPEAKDGGNSLSFPIQ
ncbi:hypothetical protein V6N13_075937 [Hibiscus sabdariffa]|uniref:Uncharacterized protein n=1 Tax=Hibiscus sabdariffa TaxID=183260 RepID=A0ABR2UDD7_9ROSI